MSKNFEELEDMFGDLNNDEKVVNQDLNQGLFDKIPEGFEEYKTQKINPINAELVNYYLSRRDLLEGDIEAGIIPKDLANDLRNAIYAYREIEKENPPIYSEGNSEMKNKQKVKTKNEALHVKYDLGFAETLLLGLVVSSLGLVYLGYLYLVI